jgi:hypothetical protein
MHACHWKVATRAITVSLALTAATSVTAEPVEWTGNGHFYELIEHPEGMSWYEARDEAHEIWHNGIRGHLATITSAAESDFLLDVLLPTGVAPRAYWVGGFQSDGSPEPAGGWEWLTGEPWSFTNWHSTEPNNGGDENVLEVYGPNSSNPMGRWNDMTGGTDTPDYSGSYIIEWPTETPAYAHSFVNPTNGHVYYASETMMTAPVAEAWARSLGGHLVTVNDAAENDWLHDTLAGAGYTHFWIGLTDEEAYGGGEAGDDPHGGWVWMSGETVDYLNWNPGEPNGATYPGQDYVEMHISGNWNDLENITPRHGVAEVGEPLFLTGESLSVSANPYSVATADVDGDGDLDLVVAQFSNDSLQILENDGEGSFAAAAAYDVGDGPVHVVAADLDDDGDADLAVVNHYDATLSVLLNDASGAFAAPAVYTCETGPMWISIADMDGNGNPDLAVANADSDSISLFMNTAAAASRLRSRTERTAIHLPWPPRIWIRMETSTWPWRTITTTVFPSS